MATPASYTAGLLQTPVVDPKTGMLTPAWQRFFTAMMKGALPGYTVSNLTIDRTYDATATSVAELARVLGSLINDLTAAGYMR